MREELAVRANLVVGPGAGRGAMENVQAIGLVDLGLRLIVGDDAA
jgi:hypothetical protein